MLLNMTECEQIDTTFRSHTITRHLGFERLKFTDIDEYRLPYTGTEHHHRGT